MSMCISGMIVDRCNQGVRGDDAASVLVANTTNGLSGIDFQLQEGGSLSGSLTFNFGSPLAGGGSRFI